MSTLGVARVYFQAETGNFNRDISEAEARYRQTTGAMSDDALRMQVAQERLQRTLARYGPESRQAAQATLQLRAAQRQATVGTARLSSELGSVRRRSAEAGVGLRRLEGDFERAGRGALAGSQLMRGFRTALVFGSTSFIGTFGLTAVVRKTIDAAREQEQVQASLRQTLDRTNISWDANRQHISAALKAQQSLTGFDDEELGRSFNALVRRTGDVNQALRLNALVADVARGRHMDLQAAVTLVTRASLGQVGSLRRLGLDVRAVTAAQDGLRASGVKVTVVERRRAQELDRQATAQRVIAALQRSYGGQAAAFARTDAGAQARFNATLNDTQEIVGKALTPALTHLFKSLDAYLTRLNSSGRLQADVARDAHQFGEALHGAGDFARGLASVLGPLNSTLGGTRRTVQLLAEAFVLLKLTRWARELGLLRVATRQVGQAAAVTAVEERGLAAAETQVGRSAVASRIQAYTGAVRLTGAAAATSATRVGRLRAALTGLSGLAVAPIVVPIIVDVADRASNKLHVNDDFSPSRFLHEGFGFLHPFAHKGPLLNYLLGHGFRTDEERRAARDAQDGLNNFTPTNEPNPRPLPPAGRRGAAPPPRRRGGRLSLAAQLSLNDLRVAQDALTASTADDVRDLAVRAQLLRRQIAAEKNVGKKTQETNDLAAVLSQLQQIADDKQKAADDRRQHAREARAKRLERQQRARRAREKALNDKIKRLYAEDIAGSTSNANQALRDRSEYLNKKYGLGISSAAAASKDAAASKIDALAILREFQSSLRGLYGGASNVFTEDAQGRRTPGSVTVVQNFSAPPTSDGHREAILAKHAAQAVFD